MRRTLTDDERPYFFAALDVLRGAAFLAVRGADGDGVGAPAGEPGISAVRANSMSLARRTIQGKRISESGPFSFAFAIVASCCSASLLLMASLSARR